MKSGRTISIHPQRLTGWFRNLTFNGRTWSIVRIGHHAGKRPHDSEQGAERAAVAAQLDFCLFRYLKRVIDPDSKVSNGASQLAMPKQ